jgi:hypothetical protein
VDVKKVFMLAAIAALAVAGESQARGRCGERFPRLRGFIAAAAPFQRSETGCGCGDAACTCTAANRAPVRSAVAGVRERIANRWAGFVRLGCQ